MEEFVDGKYNIVKIPFFLNFIFRLIKSQQIICAYQTKSKFYMEMQKTQSSQHNTEKQIMRSDTS
jgi:hypothetical protein